MLDTKLKKTHKKLHIVTIAVILLAILVPSIIMTALLPKMEESANALQAEEKAVIKWMYDGLAVDAIGHILNTYALEKDEDDISDWYYGYVKEDFKKRASSIERYGVLYYIQAGEKVYSNMEDELRKICVESADKGFTSGMSDDLLIEQKVIGYFSTEIVLADEDTNGCWIDAYYTELTDRYFDTYSPQRDIYNKYDVNKIANILGNCQAIYMIMENSNYPMHDENIYYIQREEAYVMTGAVWVALAILGIMAIIMFVLPLIPGIRINDMKLFRMPLLAEVVIGALFVCAVMGMFALGLYSPGAIMDVLYEELLESNELRIIGVLVTKKVVENVILFVNLLGWCVTFALELITFVALQQIVRHPVQHFKDRTITTIIFRWFVKRVRKFKEDILNADLKKSTLVIWIVLIAINFVIVSLLCCLWFYGIIGVILYTGALIIMALALSLSIKLNYKKILDASKQMGEGNLKVEIGKNLGMFNELGRNLEKIQMGFSDAVQEEAKSQNMKTELITNVSHDLKTPLTAIITYVNLLKDENITEEERRQYIDTLDMKSQRLKSLIEDLFEISKANSGNVTMNYMDVDIVGLIKQVRLELEDKIADSNLVFRWNLPEEKVILSLDSQRTYRIFANLITNAIKYSMEGTRVYVELENNGKEVKIIMKNTSKAEMNLDPEQLTERFVRGDLARNSEGSGLGLAIVKSFVELQGGRFGIETDGDLFKAVIVWGI